MDSNDTPSYFGEWLSRRRSTLDLTQGELAQRAGCSVYALRKIESGERRPSKQLAGLLARALNIPSEDQATFIRVARGELNIERLGVSAAQGTGDHPGIVSPLLVPPVKIPIPGAAIIGRQTELAALGRLFADPQCRLVTITSLGGIGKTRLALELASQESQLFPGRVYYVSLASLNSADYVLQAIAEGVGYTVSGLTDLKGQLFNYLHGLPKPAILLVLDNLEHLLQEADTEQPVVTLIAEMLRRLPKLSILITSRERLGLQGEWTFELSGLPVPAERDLIKREEYSSVAVFRGGFNRQAVVERLLLGEYS